jgi:hypothetical protein
VTAPAASRMPPPPGLHRCLDLGEFGLGVSQQFGAGAGPVSFQHRVVAADQPLARVVRVGDLGEVLGVEQRHLQRPIIGGQLFDGGRFQRGDPVHARQLAQVGDPSAGDHPPVAGQDQALDTEVAADAGDRVLNDSGSDVLPANTSTATGSVSSPYPACRRPRLPSREYPNAASLGSGPCRASVRFLGARELAHDLSCMWPLSPLLAKSHP